MILVEAWIKSGEIIAVNCNSAGQRVPVDMGQDFNIVAVVEGEMRAASEVKEFLTFDGKLKSTKLNIIEQEKVAK